MTTLDLVFADFEVLKTNIDRINQNLQSRGVLEELNARLHDPDQLPDEHLVKLSSELIDGMDQLQLMLAPSVSLLVDGFFGFLNSKVLLTVVEARVPDHLAKHGSLPASELGSICGIQPLRLGQLMDTLVNNGIFAHDRELDVYSNNRASRLLCRDHWTQWHRWVTLYPDEMFDISRSMPQAVRLGEDRNAAQLEHGTELDIFEYFSRIGKLPKFQSTMGAGAIAQSKGLTVDYPWESVQEELIVDLGGGNGAFLAALLRAYPTMRGSLLDREHAIKLVKPAFRNADGAFADVGPRVQDLVIGNFLIKVPPSKVYTMKWCLHDWADHDVLTILRTVRRNITVSPVSRFVILESVKQPLRSGRLPRYGDLIMMITCNGQERSREDWERLAKGSGWRIDAIYFIRNAWPSAIDFRPV